MADEEALEDRPIRSSKDDHLDRGPFVESLVRALVRPEKDREGHLIARHSTGYVVGLTGRWGLGKSSVLNLVEQRLRDMQYVVVATFNPWLFRGRDELLNGFFNALREAMGRSITEHVADLREDLNRYWAAIAGAGDAAAIAADAHGGGGAFSATWKWIKNHKPSKPEPLSPTQERAHLEQKLLSSKAAVVVLIDELDRVEDDEVRAVAQLVKAVGDIRGISYLVAYDPERVADALGRGEGPARREHGERYLEKIIQHPIPLRPLFDDDVTALLTAALDAHQVGLPAPSAEQVKTLDVVKQDIESPRDVKRLIGAFAVVEAAVRGEMCPYDVLAYCWILTKAPVLRDAIAAVPDKLVDDPTEKELSARVVDELSRKPAPTPAELLGASAAPFDSVLKHIFPRFGISRSSNEEQGVRISKRRNLIRLLYLGNPPTMVPRGEVERIWLLTNPVDIDFELKRLLDAGLLHEFLDRLDDLLSELPPAGDPIFWLGISRLVTRSHDWITAIETFRSIAEEAGTAILHLAMRDPTQARRAQVAVEALIAGGDLVIVPYVLRKLLFHFGMTNHSTRSRSDVLIFSASETSELLAREGSRYRAAVLNGTALRRLTNVEAIYVLANTGQWDDELRNSLTQQLDGPEAIATLAALLVPPGFSADRSALDQLFDADAVTDRLIALREIENWVSDSWVRASVRRLTKILRGIDPMLSEEPDGIE